MEKMTYQEARGWFWTRTLVWFFPAALVTFVAFLVYSGQYMSDVTSSIPQRVWVSVAVGLIPLLIAVLSALLSLWLPWMRSGRPFSFMLTAPFCFALASFIMFLLGGLVLALIQNYPIDVRPFITKEFARNVDMWSESSDLIDAVYKTLWFCIYASGLWGGIFGVWFSLRRDKYFVEII